MRLVFFFFWFLLFLWQVGDVYSYVVSLRSFWVGVVLFLIVTRSFQVIPTLCLPRPDDIEVQYIAASRVLSGRSGLNYRSRHPWQSSP